MRPSSALFIAACSGGTPLHLDAAISLAALSGTWRDSAGNTGAWVFTAGAGAPGSPRPVPRLSFPGGVSGGGGTVTNVGAPTAASDAAKKGYVDAYAKTVRSTPVILTAYSASRTGDASVDSVAHAHQHDRVEWESRGDHHAVVGSARGERHPELLPRGKRAGPHGTARVLRRHGRLHAALTDWCALALRRYGSVSPGSRSMCRVAHGLRQQHVLVVGEPERVGNGASVDPGPDHRGETGRRRAQVHVLTDGAGGRRGI